MKSIYEFTVDKEQEVDEIETTTNDKGEEVKITKKVKKTVPKKFFIKKETRSLREEAELFYGIQLADGVKKGLLTISMLDKRIVADGGALSDIEQKQYEEDRATFVIKQKQLFDLNEKSEKTKEDEEKIKELQKDVASLFEKIQQVDIKKNSFYENTAEVRARNRTVFWWALHLAYFEDDNGQIKPLFGDGDFNQKLATYDKFEDEGNPFWTKVVNKLSYYITAWNMGIKPDELALLNPPE